MWTAPSGRTLAEEKRSLTYPSIVDTLILSYSVNDVDCDAQAAGGGSIGQIADFYEDLHSRLVRRVVAKGRFIRDTTLDTPGNMRVWLNNYLIAFAGVRGLEGVHAAADYNENIREMKSVGMTGGRYDRLAGLARRLASFSIAPEFRSLIDRYFGVFHLPEQDLTLISLFEDSMTASTVHELKTAADWDAIMDDIGAALDILASAVNDYQRIMNIFGLTFGLPAPLPDKVAFSGLAAIWPHFSQMISYHDSVGVLNYSVPNYDTDGSGLVSLALLSEPNPYLLTYLRPSVHGLRTAPNAATPQALGLIGPNPATLNQSHGLRWYLKDETTGVISFINAGAVSVSTRRDTVSQFFWADMASALQVSNANMVQKAPGVALVSVTHEFLVSETLVALEKMWLTTEPVGR
jgi:hypothetical protein